MAAVRAGLRPVDPEALAVGAALPGDLRDAEGRVLVRAGEVLTDARLKQLEPLLVAGAYAGPDWGRQDPSPSLSPAEVVDGLFRREGSNNPVRDQRVFRRHLWAVPLTLLAEESSGTRRAYREIHVTAADLSRSGFAFNYRQYIAKGTRIRVQFDTLPGCPESRGRSAIADWTADGTTAWAYGLSNRKSWRRRTALPPPAERVRGSWEKGLRLAPPWVAQPRSAAAAQAGSGQS